MWVVATKARIDNRKKKLAKQQCLPTCSHNMVNFGSLAVEIGSLVWGTPANFNGFRVLASLLHGSLVLGVSQTAALNRGRYLYSAGRAGRSSPLSSFFFVFFCTVTDLLLAPTVSSLQQLLFFICESELAWLDLSINVSKSSCIGLRVCCNLTGLDGREIMWVEKSDIMVVIHPK